MIRHEVGDDDIFFLVLQSFLEKHANSVASAEDFRNTLENITQNDYTDFFDQWYYGEGYPILDFHWFQKGDSLIIEVNQETSAGSVTPFFKLLIDLKISCMEGDTLMQIRPEYNGDKIAIELNKKVYNVTPDPDKWLLGEIRSVSRIFDTDSMVHFNIFPNPVKNEVFIENYKIGLPFEAKLYNAEGIFIDELSGAEAFASFFIAELASGIYQIVVTRDQVREVFKIAIL